jgi:copper chaperone CopZ
MTCGLCEKAIEKSLRALAGVRRIEVDRESKRVSVVAEPAIATDRLEAAIESAGGFEAQWIQTE